MLNVSLGRLLKRIATHLPLEKQAEIVAAILPRRMWFRAALVLSGFQGGLVARMGGNGPLTRALMLDHWLRQLTMVGPFPIPYRVTGLPVLKMKGPKLYTWTHLPLVEVPLRAIVEQGEGDAAVVADQGKVEDGERFLVVGLEHHPKAIRVDDHLLMRVCRRLQSGSPVCFLADPFLGAPLSDVPLRIAARLRVPIVVQWAELAADHVFDITFRLAPFPYPQSAPEMEANLAFLAEAKERTLRNLGWPLPAAPAHDSAGAALGHRAPLG